MLTIQKRAKFIVYLLFQEYSLSTIGGFLNKRSQKVQSYFHRSAKEFDRLYHETGSFSYFLNRLFRRALYQRAESAVQEILQCGAKSVLDVGSGSGINAVLFAQNGVQNVIGVDYAQGMVDLAISKRPPELASCVSYIQADFLTWESLDAKFDCVVALGVFDYLDLPDIFLKKMISCAQKKVLFSVPKKGGLRFFQRSLRYRLKNCPIYFYSKLQLEDLMITYTTSFKIIDVGSSSFLCVLDLEQCEA